MPTSTAIAARACEVCKQRDQLSRCSACQAVYYCSREHQASDRADHKEACGAVKKARLRLEREEKKLRDSPGDMFTPANLFENGVGHFWGIHETRPYMRSRYGLVDALLLNFGQAGGRLDAAQVALDHLLDMLRLCRGDNMGVRDIVPSLYIRLGNDQGAYDFVKWYATTGSERDYDWGNTDLPFLDVKNADVFESLEESWTGDYIALSHAVAVCLIKVRVLRDLQAIQNTRRALQGTLPAEMVDLIRKKQMVGNILKSRPEIFSASMDEIADLIQKIQGQIKNLYRAITNYNHSFWMVMIDSAEEALATRPEGYSPRSPEEAVLIIGYSYAAWAETPGALEEMEDLAGNMTEYIRFD